MTLSPKKYVSNFTSSTTNRGVEAKEIEIANTRLDVRASSRTAPIPPPPPPAPPSPPSHDEPDDTASYIQVEVRRARHPRRLPAASSPAPPAPPATPAPSLPQRGLHSMEAVQTGAEVRVQCARAAAGDLPLPECAELCAGAAPNRRHGRGECEGGGGAAPGGAGAGDAAHSPDDGSASEKLHGLSVWKKFGGYGDGNDSDSSGRPERVEVYYFERGSGAWLATSDAAREARVERAARGVGRHCRRAVGEVLAGARLAAGGAVWAAVAAERAALLAARGAAVGAVQTAADYALKPALALLFNAALHPPLVFAGNVARAVRDALRPVWGALHDALEPLARLLASVRLVHVHVERQCSCARAV